MGNRPLGRIANALILALMAGAAPALARTQPPQPPTPTPTPTPAPAPAAQEEHLGVLVGQSRVVTAPWPTARVSVTDPSVADVEALTPGQVLVLGKKLGTTDLLMWSKDEELRRMRVDVTLDLERLGVQFAEMFPDADLRLAQRQNVLVVGGTVRRAEEIASIKAFMAASGLPYVDQTSVAGVQQVLLQVRIAEVSRTAVQALGINALHTSDSFFGASVIGSSGGGPLNPISIGPAKDAVAGNGVPFVFGQGVNVSPAVTLFGGFPGADLQFFVQALEENQYLRILAEPNLVALSGEEASFLAGGEFPIPVVQGGSGESTSVTVEYREFGVRLKFKPLVLGDGTIRLSVAPEVSDLSDVGAVEIQGFRIPGVVTRRANTTIELNSGQTFAMAGLINSRTDARNTSVPGLGSLPIIGALFRSVRYATGQTEMVVMVTASLVEPLSTAGPLPGPGMLHTAPNDWELYAAGRIEGKNAPRLAPADAAWLQEKGLNRLRGPGTWATHGQAPAQGRNTARTPAPSTGDDPAPRNTARR